MQRNGSKAKFALLSYAMGAQKFHFELKISMMFLSIFSIWNKIINKIKEGKTEEKDEEEVEIDFRTITMDSLRK